MEAQLADLSIKDDIMTYEPTAALCYQCGTCTTVCPVTDFGMNTRLLMKKVNVGLIDDWVKKTVWLCLGCGLCELNCPNKIRIPNVIKYVRYRLIDGGFKQRK